MTNTNGFAFCFGGKKRDKYKMTKDYTGSSMMYMQNGKPRDRGNGTLENEYHKQVSNHEIENRDCNLDPHRPKSILDNIFLSSLRLNKNRSSSKKTCVKSMNHSETCPSIIVTDNFDFNGYQRIDDTRSMSHTFSEQCLSIGYPKSDNQQNRSKLKTSKYDGKSTYRNELVPIPSTGMMKHAAKYQLKKSHTFNKTGSTASSDNDEKNLDRSMPKRSKSVGDLKNCKGLRTLDMTKNAYKSGMALNEWSNESQSLRRRHHSKASSNTKRRLATNVTTSQNISPDFKNYYDERNKIKTENRNSYPDEKYYDSDMDTRSYCSNQDSFRSVSSKSSILNYKSDISDDYISHSEYSSFNSSKSNRVLEHAGQISESSRTNYQNYVMQSPIDLRRGDNQIDTKLDEYNHLRYKHGNFLGSKIICENREYDICRSRSMSPVQCKDLMNAKITDGKDELIRKYTSDIHRNYNEGDLMNRLHNSQSRRFIFQRSISDSCENNGQAGCIPDRSHDSHGSSFHPPKSMIQAIPYAKYKNPSLSVSHLNTTYGIGRPINRLITENNLKKELVDENLMYRPVRF